MSRRDTIIIAVLVNAGLLMVLFATATRSSDGKKEKCVTTTQLAKSLPAKPVEGQTTSIEDDLLDHFLEAPFDNHREEIALQELPPPEPVIEVPKPAASRDDDNFVNVTVKKGDFLEKIAKANNTSVTAIMKANALNTTNLKVGQVLKVPVNERRIEAVATASAQEEYYVVKDGDNPWLIASKNRVRLEDLLKINGLDEQKARRLRPGDRLKIR